MFNLLIFFFCMPMRYKLYFSFPNLLGHIILIMILIDWLLYWLYANYEVQVIVFLFKLTRADYRCQWSSCDESAGWPGNENGCKSVPIQSKNHHHHRCLGHHPHHHLVNGNIGPVDVHQRVSIRTILFVADPKVVQHLVDYHALSIMIMVLVMVI